MGSKPKAPEPIKPDVYQTVVPLESYKMAAEYANRLKAQTGDLWSELGRQSGTSAEVAARQAKIRALETEAYRSSIPSGDKYLAQTTGRSDQTEGLKDAASFMSDQARSDYLEALTKKDEPDAALEKIITPSWSQSTIKAGMPK